MRLLVSIQSDNQIHFYNICMHMKSDVSYAYICMLLINAPHVY